MKCHACGAPLFPSVLNLGNIPLVDRYRKDKDKALKTPTSPLSLHQCSKCKTYQIKEIVDPEQLYSDYIYNSSSSKDLSEHFDEYINFLNTKINLPKDARILEIGGNDGLLLKKLYDKGFHDLTVIDPAPQVKNCESFSTVYREHFGSNKSKEILGNQEKFDLVIANNCLAHIPKLKDIFDLIEKSIRSNGYLIFEVNSLYHQVINDVFDYIYHEHIFYHSVTSLEKLLSLSNFFINNIKIVPTKGGSLRVICSKNKTQSYSLNYWKIKEKSIDLHEKNPLIFKSLNEYIPFLKESINSLIKEGKYNKVYAFGASATSTILIETLEIGPLLSGIIDDNPERQGRYSPGQGIPVFSNLILEEEDLLINLAWRHHKLIMKTLSKSKIRKIISPIPFPSFVD